jgi:hypothetical protein
MVYTQPQHPNTMAILNAMNPVNTSSPVSPCEILKIQAGKLRVEATTFSSPHHKTVRFAEHENKYYANNVMNEDECRRLWHTPYDFQKMKEHNTNFVKNAMKQDRIRADDDKSYANIVKRVYETCCAEASEANLTISSSVLSAQDQKAFIHLVEKANARTGLERTIVRELTYDKRTRRTQVAKTILEIQQRFVNSVECTNANMDVSKLMRKASETISLPATLFARELANALAISLR